METIRAIRRSKYYLHLRENLEQFCADSHFIAQDEQADRHDLFKAALADSKDKFATISEWFGRGVMVSPPTVEG